MHRSNFRPRRQQGDAGQPVKSEQPAQSPSVAAQDVDSLREQIVNITRSLTPMRAAIDTLVEIEKSDNIAVPKDMAKSIHLMHERLSRVERQQEKAFEQAKKVETTFSNALLKMGDKVEKISGGEDSEFSLAHSLEKLMEILNSRKYRIIRDAEGNMVSVETE